MRRTPTTIAALVLLAAPLALLAAPAQAQTAPVLTMELDPTSGPVGTTVAISGVAEQCPTDTQMFAFRIVTGDTVGPATIPVTWDGTSFTASLTIPPTRTDSFSGGTAPLVPGDVVTIRLNCPVGPATADFTVTAPPATTTSTTVVAPPTTVPPFAPPATPPADAPAFQGPAPGATPPGGTVTIAEPGFQPGETVVVVLYSDPKVLATAQADAEGTVRIAVALPSDTAPGAHTLVLFGETQVRKAPLEVLALPTQVPGATTPTLPRTGGSTAATGASAGAAALLLVAGSGLVLLSSRRRARA